MTCEEHQDVSQMSSADILCFALMTWQVDTLLKALEDCAARNREKSTSAEQEVLWLI